MLGLGLPKANAALEENFASLQIGTHVYSNVTVTTRAKGYIFILHSAGMTNIKVADLSAEVRRKLGYDVPEEKATVSTPAAWAKQTMAKFEKPKGIGKQLADWGRTFLPTDFRIPQISTQLLLIAGGLLLTVYVLFSFGCLLISQKSGGHPGILAFIPLLQCIPLLRAAGMSPWWLLAAFVPVLNVVANVIWCLKIVQARQKNGWLVLFLLLPGTNLLAFLYLAFSDASPSGKEAPQAPQIMTLETA